MRNKNTCKKLCSIMIAVGLVFSGGQLAHAHNQKLKDAEAMVASNPTIENLTYIRKLYRKDIKKHKLNHEFDEALLSSKLAHKIKEQRNELIEKEITSTLQLAKSAAYSLTWAGESACWATFLKKSFEFEETIRNCPSIANNALDSFLLHAARVFVQADIESTAPFYEYSKLCWNITARLAHLAGNINLENICDTNAVWAKAKSMQVIANTDQKESDYSNAEIAWNFAASHFNEMKDSDNERMARQNAERARNNATMAREIAERATNNAKK